jgi:GTP-binding protein Era
MIVGKGGEAIKRIGIGARKIMEQFALKKIHLELIVTVKPGWSKNKIELERFGYIF